MRGNSEKAESELEGRLLRVHLTVKYYHYRIVLLCLCLICCCYRESGLSFNVVCYHGYTDRQKGNRSKIELLEKLRGAKGLSKSVLYCSALH